MSVGEIAGLIAAVAFVALVAIVAIPIIKFGKTIDELTRTVHDVRTEHVAKTSTTVDEANELMATTNSQLKRVDAITKNAQSVTDNVAALAATFAATVGGPMIRAAAFTYGVRKVLSKRREKASSRGKKRRGRR